MKLVDISEFYSESGGGVRSYVNQKFAWCAREGREFTLIAPGSEDRVEVREGGKIVWVKCNPIPVDKRYYLFGKPDAVNAILEDEQPDVIEASSPWQGGRIAAKWPGRAVKSFFVHADPVASYPETFIEPVLGGAITRFATKWFWKYLQNLTNACDTIVVSSKHMRSRYIRFGLSEPVVIPLGLNKKRFSPDLRDEVLRAEMLAACHLSPTARLLISISRFHPEKRVPAMIRCVEKVNETRPVGLVVVGDGLSRRSVDRVASKVPQVHLAGTISDRELLPRMLASSDGFFHAGASETFCIVAGEAMASGLPMIIPNRGGVSDFASPAFTETWTSPRTQEGVDAILRLLARERKGMVNHSNHYAQTHLNSPDQHFSALFAHYEQLIAQKKSVGTS